MTEKPPTIANQVRLALEVLQGDSRAFAPLLKMRDRDPETQPLRSEAHAEAVLVIQEVANVLEAMNRPKPGTLLGFPVHFVDGELPLPETIEVTPVTTEAIAKAFGTADRFLASLRDDPAVRAMSPGQRKTFLEELADDLLTMAKNVGQDMADGDG